MYIVIVIVVIVLILLILLFARPKQTHYAITIAAHKLDGLTLNLWEKCRQELGPKRVFMLFDATRSEDIYDFEKKYPGHVVIFDDKQCKAVNPLFKSSYDNMDCKLAFLYERVRLPEFTWMIETDVYCDGNIRDTLDKCRDSSDFISSAIKRWSKDNNWPHWSRLEGDASSIPMDRRWGCFFPVCRFSKRFLKCVRDFYYKGKQTGYCEVYFPTLAYNHGFTISELPKSIHGDISWEHNYDQNTIPKLKNNKLYHRYLG